MVFYTVDKVVVLQSVLFGEKDILKTIASSTSIALYHITVLLMVIHVLLVTTKRVAACKRLRIKYVQSLLRHQGSCVNNLL